MQPSGLNRQWTVCFCLVAALGLFPEPAWAWGPATHYHLANRLLEMGLLASSLEALLCSYRHCFQYGNVIADVVVGKDLIEFEEHSHNWNVARTMKEQSETDEDRAFALGFWTHLAADTVAHNLFVPRQILTTASTSKLGHSYWELRADEKIPTEAWNELKDLLEHDFSRQNDLLEEAIPRTVLPFSVNHLIHKSLMNLHSLEYWQKLVLLFSRFSRYHLSDDEMNKYHDLCLDRMADSLASGETQQAVLDIDPTGGDLDRSMKQAREAFQEMMARGAMDESAYGDVVNRFFPGLDEIEDDGLLTQRDQSPDPGS